MIISLFFLVSYSYEPATMKDNICCDRLCTDLLGNIISFYISSTFDSFFIYIFKCK